MVAPISLYSVNAILILSTENGERVFAKYYSPPHHATGQANQPATESPYADLKAQKAFEKGLLEKAGKGASGEIILYDNRVVLYKIESDVGIYVVGNADENEVLLYNALLALRDTLHLLYRANVDRRTIVENYDLTGLAIDELCDDGVILETDPTIILSRVSKAPTQDVVPLGRIDPFSEQGVKSLAQIGQAKLTDWLRQGL
ncbi:hypothetical protein P8C59_007896 [Phyllachora maydis]|uniref:Coatomer subunit zeta n=1 Tax=Phyllachora maydis TaxID=1825666 RepID=A0AAD9IAN2_9PEZI|nr:hypothetical protein P8C59_007896 [Phyllachora maydis]